MGLAAAQYLLNKHHNIVAVARSKEPLQQLQSAHPELVEYLAGDLADFALGQKAVDLAVSKFGHLDALIINHGVLNPVKRISDTDAKEWSEAFDINVFSAIAMVQICCSFPPNSKLI
jgi:NAD(P)-dependent dehydrogenase (short-subunit alcohol dehydrogenase family)